MIRSRLSALLATGMVAALLVLLPAMAVAGEQTRIVAQENQFLYPEPALAGPPIDPVPAGVTVKVLKRAADWCRVEYQGKIGWLPEWAFRRGETPVNLRPILTGEGVKPNSRDEVALAGMAERQPRQEEFRPCVGKPATILADNQPLYAAPNSGGKALARLPAAAQVKVVDQQGSWLKVEYRGKTGWLPARAVKVD